MNRVGKFACVFCGVYYLIVGALLFFAPSVFFRRVAPIGSYNEHYSIDLGSFVLPVGLALLFALRDPKSSQPIIGLAAFSSLLHLLSHLRDGIHWGKAISGDAFFLFVAMILIAALVVRKSPSHEES